MKKQDFDSFQEDLMRSLMKQIVKSVDSQTSYVRPDARVPDHIFKQVWADVNWQTVIDKVKVLVEEAIASRVASRILVGIGKDVEHYMSDKTRRERLFASVIPALEAINADAD